MEWYYAVVLSWDSVVSLAKNASSMVIGDWLATDKLKHIGQSS